MAEILTRTEKIESLRKRVTDLKPKLYAIKGWKQKLLIRYPQYDSMYWATFLGNLLNGRTTDENVISHLEEIVSIHGDKK